MSLHEIGDPAGWDHSYRPDGMGFSEERVIHRTREIAAGLYAVECYSCAAYAELATRAIRIHDRLNSGESVVECSHHWSGCSWRDEDGLIPAETAYYCPECGLHFCADHHHARPTGVRQQQCVSCQTWFPRCVDLEFCESHEAWYCGEHEHSVYCEDGDGWDRDFDYREPELLFSDEGDHPLATGKRFAAVEIECEDGSGFALPRRFGITEDGSLNDGVEVTLPPARGKALVNDLRLAMDTLSDAGWNVDSYRTSMHTHIDLRDKREDMVFLSRLFATFYAVEDVLFGMQDQRREENSYCEPLRNGWKFYDAYGKWAPDFEYVYNKQAKTPQGKRYVEGLRNHKGGNRYNAFNFQSVVYRGSLEVRLHEGCLDYRRAALWIELLQFIIARVERGVTYKQLRTLLEMDASTEKVAAMVKFFSLPPVVADEMYDRLRSLSLRYRLGTPQKGRNPDPDKASSGRATHFHCHDCYHWVDLRNPSATLSDSAQWAHPVGCSRRRYNVVYDVLGRIDRSGLRIEEQLGYARDLMHQDSVLGRQAARLVVGGVPRRRRVVNSEHIPVQMDEIGAYVEVAV